MKITKNTFLEIFNEHFNKIDEELIAILKGHLLIEKALNQIIDDFVFHSDKLLNAKLTFPQKVHIARSISLNQSENTMWSLVLAINSLRNEFAHQLESPKKQTKIDKVKNLYVSETKNSDLENIWETGQVTGIAYSITLILGFLITFHEEVQRFKEMVNEMDKLINRNKE